MSYYDRRRDDYTWPEIIAMFALCGILLVVLAYCQAQDNKNCVERGGKVMHGTREDFCVEPGTFR